MSQPCAIIDCKRASRALCHCCKQNICIPHLNEHNDILNVQLYPLADEINILGERFKRFNIQDIVGDCRQKLEQWCEDCHKMIDHYFKQKCQELDRLVAEKLDKQQENITNIRSKMVELLRDQAATWQDIDTLTSTIHNLEQEINKIEQSYMRIESHSLVIDDKMVQFKEIHANELDSSIFSSFYNTIVRLKGSSRALASNGQRLLIHQTPNLCLLDSELTIIKKIVWPYSSPLSMCWSSLLNRFILIVMENIFLIDEHTMSIESIQTIEKQRWFSCTCFENRLFLSTFDWGSSIVEIRLLPSIGVTKEWKSPTTCTMNESIDEIAYNNEALALLIRNKVQSSMRMELRSSKTLDRLWLLLLDVVYNTFITFHCCLINYNEWLVADYDAGRLLHVTADGNIKQIIIYESIPSRICMFSSSMLAIATEKSFNFHKL